MFRAGIARHPGGLRNCGIIPQLGAPKSPQSPPAAASGAAKGRSNNDRTWKNRGRGAQSDQGGTIEDRTVPPGYCGTIPAAPADGEGLPSL